MTNKNGLKKPSIKSTLSVIYLYTYAFAMTLYYSYIRFIFDRLVVPDTTAAVLIFFLGLLGIYFLTQVL